MAPNPEVADAVRATMARRRVSQEQLATSLGRSQAAVSRRVSGRVEFTASELVTIARVLDVPVETFFVYTAGAA